VVCVLMTTFKLSRAIGTGKNPTNIPSVFLLVHKE